MKKIIYIASFIVLAAAACGDNDGGSNGTVTAPETSGEAPATIPFTVVNKFPHDTAYFTEGLEFYKGQLLESSGGNADSSPFPTEFGVVNRSTGKVETKAKLDPAKHFGEGITVFNDKIYQLTWTSRVGFIYDANTFKLIRQFNIPAREGWGLTHDSASLIMSDGSSNLYYLDPETLQVKYSVSVIHNGNPIGNINELEYVNGVLYANRWGTNNILRIDPVSGKVLGQLDLSAQEKEAKDTYEDADVLNGIAFDHATGKLFVTGKKWPFIYEIKPQ